MLSPNERVPATRSIRNHLLNYQDRKGPGSTTEGALRELTAAVKELTLLVRREIPETWAECPSCGREDVAVHTMRDGECIRCWNIHNGIP